MLSTDTLLWNGRYRIGHAISTGRSGAMYTAQDQLSNLQVAIIESTLSATNPDEENKFENLVKLRHDGLAHYSDNFQENGYFYSVTEPIRKLEIAAVLEEAPNSNKAAAIFERLGTILLGLNVLRSEIQSLKPIDIMPENIIETVDGKLKLLYVENGILSASNPSDSPYLPFECIWDSLDLISQRAFYRVFDDKALEALESEPDERSELYSLGAVFYKSLSGQTPVSALERSVEMLENKNPLSLLSSLNKSVNEAQSQFVMKMLELKREDRFASIEDAIMNLPSMTQNTDSAVSQKDKVEIDDLDLLEIPTDSPHGQIVVSANGKGNGDAKQVLDELVALSEMEVSPEASLQNEDLHSFVEQFYVSDRPKADLTQTKPAEEENSNETVPAAVPVITKVNDTVEFAFETEEAASQSSSLPKIVGFAAAGVIAVAIAGWAILSPASSENPQDQTPVTSSAAFVTPSEQPSPSTDNVIQPQTTTAVEQNATVPYSPENQPDTRSTAVKTRPQTAELKQPKPTPSAKPDQKPKKKITVDDLLN